MIVKELIALLAMCPQDARVTGAYDDFYGSSDIGGVAKDEDGDIVIALMDEEKFLDLMDNGMVKRFAVVVT